MNKVFLAHLSVFGAMVIYGANFVIMKRVTPEFIDPFGLVVHRAVFACLLFFITGLFLHEKMAKSDILKCAVLALFGVAINQMLFIKGLSLTSPIHASIMMLTSPIIVVVLALVFKKEPLRLNKILGILIGLSGAAFVVLYGGNTKKAFDGNWQGDVMVFVNALSWGIYLIFVRPLMQKYNTITIVKWVFLFGGLYALPFGFKKAIEIDFYSFDATTIFNYAYVILITTYLAYILNTYALRNLSSSVVSAYIYLQPILAVIFGVLYGMDSLTINTALGAGVVFGGVFLVSYNPTNNKLKI